MWWVADAWAEPEMIPIEVLEAAKAASTGADASDITLPTSDGGTFRMADHRGSPVVLSFWASWCGPCRAELPALATWAATHPDVQVLTVNVDRQRPPADRFLQSVRFDLPVAYDPDAKELGRFGVMSMPTMFLFDRAGAFIWSHTGYSAERGFTELDAALGGVR